MTTPVAYWPPRNTHTSVVHIISFLKSFTLHSTGHWTVCAQLKNWSTKKKTFSVIWFFPETTTGRRRLNCSGSGRRMNSWVNWAHGLGEPGVDTEQYSRRHVHAHPCCPPDGRDLDSGPNATGPWVTWKSRGLGTDQRASFSVPRTGFFFSAEISEISPKTGFIGDPRFFVIPNEIFRYS
jgi:hypothetical protein